MRAFSAFNESETMAAKKAKRAGKKSATNAPSKGTVKKKATKLRKWASKQRVRKSRPVLLSGGNPQIAKGYGHVPVQAYIAARPGWRKDIGRGHDRAIRGTVPNVEKAVKWNSPFCGVERDGSFLTSHRFTRYVKVTCFRATSLDPVPPGASKHRTVR